MTSITIIEAANTISLPFYGQHIITAMAAGVAYVAMKPIVENLGMSWGTQQQKLMRQMNKFNCIHMNMVAGDSKLRQLLCIPLKKLNGWLFSINPEKVRADIRDCLIRYQEECFTALHDYWTKGIAVRQSESTVDSRTPLRGIVNRIMGKYGLTYQAVYKLVHKEFGVKHIEELTSKQTAEAVEYLAGKVIEGEWLPKQESLPTPALPDLNIPLDWWMERNLALAKGNPVKALKPLQSRNTDVWPEMLYAKGSESPTLHLINSLEAIGYDLSACRMETASALKMVSKLWPVVREVDALRGSCITRHIKFFGEKGTVMMA